jgi:very-short-patch-repair endonuclease
MINNSPLTQRGHNKYLLELRTLARTNRLNPTESEKILWHQILSNKILGFKFLRQKPVDRFILDFYCPKLLLAIEVDGESHNRKKYHDFGRDKMLSAIGIKTIRYAKDQILNNLESVLEDIKLNIITRQNEL